MSTTNNNFFKKALSQRKKLIVFYRKEISSQCYAVNLLNIYYKGIEFKDFSQETISIESIDVKNRHLLLLSNHFKEEYKKLSAQCESLTILLCECDEIIESSKKIPNICFHRIGPCNYVYEILLEKNFEKEEIESNPNIKDLMDNKYRLEFINSISKELDSYLAEYPTEDTMDFQYGIYCTKGNSNIEKLSNLKSINDIIQIRQLGKNNRIQHFEIGQTRFEKAIEKKIQYNGKEIIALMSEGDIPVVDTCYFLAKKSAFGIGITLRHNLKTKHTEFTFCCTRESGIKAGELAFYLMGGFGSSFVGSASVSSLVFDIPNK